MTTTIPFTINQPPQFTRDSHGTITSVLLTGQHIFQRMTQINIDSNGANPTQGTLMKIAVAGRIDATDSQFTQVCNAVAGMVQGEQRTLEITGTDGTNSFSVSSVAVDVPGAKLASFVRPLLGAADETGTG
jgi:hypothetical protein